MIASAPGKLILTGEYAVLDGAPALVVAVNRRAIARKHAGPRGSSPFLVAVAQEIAERYGDDDAGAKAAMQIVVDSRQFFDGDQKLGLGSSAAVTVAATALALGPANFHDVLPIASAAHTRAQRGKGSGADIAAAVLGGTLVFEAGNAQRVSWPSGVTLIPFFTGASADTVTLVNAVETARADKPAVVSAALTAIANASRAATKACAIRATDVASTGLISAIALAASATEQLAAATGIPLVPECVGKARTAMARLGGTAKTTGAGGGDVAIAVIPGTEDVTRAERYLIEAGCKVLTLSVDNTGVDLRPDAQ